MIQPFAIRARIAITLTALLVMVTPLANTAWAQTPESPTEPPVATEVATEVPPPPVETVPPVETATEVVPPPVETLPPVETATEVVPPPVETATEVVPPPVETATEVAPPPAETATDVAEQPTETATEATVTEVVETPTEEVKPPAEVDSASTPTAETQASTPTPTQEVIVPDQLTLTSAAVLEIGPGQVRDISVRYTLGSDRVKTELSVNLSAPGGESLDGWTIAPVNRGDTLEDPNDPNRAFKARIDVADVSKRQDTFDATWRLTAPAHIEKPIALQLSFDGMIHREDGVTSGANMPNLVSANAFASLHTPTMDCVAGEINTWACSIDTTHPDDDVTVNASAVIPAGWEIKLNGTSMLTEIAAPMDAQAVTAGAFTLTAEYPIGCPDKTATSLATLNLDLTYPSGEIVNLAQELTLTFERPTPTLTVTSFEFSEVNMLETLSTTGSLTVAYADAPCDWVATIQIADLHTDTYTVTDANISIVATEGRADASVTMSDGIISIQAPESASDAASGEITIHLQIDLPHQIPPGAYVIGVVTEIQWRDEI